MTLAQNLIAHLACFRFQMFQTFKGFARSKRSEQLERLKRLQQLERLERLERLPTMGGLLTAWDLRWDKRNRFTKEATRI
jgi:hypothetical protein